MLVLMFGERCGAVYTCLHSMECKCFCDGMHYRQSCASCLLHHQASYIDQGTSFQVEIQRQMRERQQRAKRKRAVQSSYRRAYILAVQVSLHEYAPLVKVLGHKNCCAALLMCTGTIKEQCLPCCRNNAALEHPGGRAGHLWYLPWLAKLKC